MLQHARGTGLPARSARDNTLKSLLTVVLKVVLKQTSGLIRVIFQYPSVKSVHFSIVKCDEAWVQTQTSAGHLNMLLYRYFSRLQTEVLHFFLTKKHKNNIFIPNLRSLKSPWWDRRGRSHTLFPTGEHKWRLRESHLRRTSLKPRSLWVYPKH